MRMIPMLSVAAVALGLFTAASLPGVARAQAPGQPGADTTAGNLDARSGPYMLMIYGNGTVVQMPVSTAAMNDAMKSSKPLGAPMAVLVSNGKAYAIANAKMTNGKMIFDYRLREGVVEHSNALDLMRAVGLDV